ncbi:ABC transporter substrate-binding protein [Gordonia sp. CPCC 206044]|uniref:ABC transporter substrate-binding protein n=1 Tax=Gordonia sp. CPCC 206044 TaxID=3140793 RepID=UPI003AF34288
MIRKKHRARLLASVGVAATVFVAACGGGGAESGDSSGDGGSPVPGGTLRAIQLGEPRSLDPAALSNTWAHHATLGNSLYGTLMINDPETLDVEYTMASDFSTPDGGKTFDLVLRPGLVFTDDTPLDAEAVKFNWDRLRDPALGSNSIRMAGQIADTSVVDPTTLKVTMKEPNPQFAQALLASSLNWIASPTALRKGRAAFDESPVGAGPFTLTHWTRQASIELSKNADFYAAPKPYLDKLTIQTVPDSNTRVNTMTTGGADLASESNNAALEKAKAAGLQTELVPTSGGQYMGMNWKKAPFNDPRARKAVQLATDLDALNTIVYDGQGIVPQTLFDDKSPFFTDVALQQRNTDEAQKLFDELAAEGKPVSFTFLSYPTSESRMLAEGLQSQLSAYDNVDVKVEVLDLGAATARVASRDFQMTISSAIIQDPDFPLWMAFHSNSPGNILGVDDAELDKALDEGRVATSPAERKAAYEAAQKRIVATVPGIWYIRATPSVTYADNVHGVDLYTLGSPLPENIWMN